MSIFELELKKAIATLEFNTFKIFLEGKFRAKIKILIKFRTKNGLVNFKLEFEITFVILQIV